MTIDLEIEFHENEIPPRCRKPRPIEHKETVKVKIREVSDEVAPIAFTIEGDRKDSVIIREYKGQLYKEANISFYNGREREPYAFDQIPWQTVLEKYTFPGTYTTRAEYIAYLKVQSRKYLIVDKTVYNLCYEPYYEIVTFGLCGDGTAIFPQFSDRSRKMVRGYSALEKDKAINDAITVAKATRDEKHISGIANLVHGEIKVLMPEMCKRKYKHLNLKLWER